MADVFISYHLAGGAGVVRQIAEELRVEEDAVMGVDCQLLEVKYE